MSLVYSTLIIVAFFVLLIQWTSWRQLRRHAQGLNLLSADLANTGRQYDSLSQSLTEQSNQLERLFALLSKQSLDQDYLISSIASLSSQHDLIRQFVINQKSVSAASENIVSSSEGQACVPNDAQSISIGDPIVFSKSKPALLNIGCGSTFDSRWINIDLNPVSDDVIAIDILRPLPLPNLSIDVVYCSHVLEHIAPHNVPGFLQELTRILKPSGILRVVVPDLEQIALEYLRALHAAKQGDPQARLLHRWMIVELLDQLVRQSADGGEMMRFLFRHGTDGVAIATQRLGSEISESPVPWDSAKTKGEWALEVADQESFSDQSLFERRSEITPQELARFRTSGEVHLWMYDKVSLSDLLLESGFIDPVVHTPFSSSIPDFASYHLDTTSDGVQRKPDSLYIEATLPESNES